MQRKEYREQNKPFLQSPFILSRNFYRRLKSHFPSSDAALLDLSTITSTVMVLSTHTHLQGTSHKVVPLLLGVSSCEILYAWEMIDDYICLLNRDTASPHPTANETVIILKLNYMWAHFFPFRNNPF